MGLVTNDEFDWLSETSIKIYEKMASIADSAGFILADLKLEFGKLGDQIILGDSIGPDEYRLWPKESYSVGKTQEAYDKQLLRDWLTENGYQKKFDESRANGKEPVAPSIPQDLIKKITERYTHSSQKQAKEAVERLVKDAKTLGNFLNISRMKNAETETMGVSHLLSMN